ncbi:ankyrin repeat domain-containing protein [Mycolicibacterium fortuitum]
MPGSPRAFNRSAAALAVIAATAAGCATPDVATVHTTAIPTTNAPSADPGQGRDLLAAASNNDAVWVRELIGRGADLEVRDERGATPLVAATKNGATEAARALIEAGADVNAKDDLQDSAYLYAGAEGLDDILELTLSHGADVRSVNRYGGTALIPASEHGHVSTVRRLIAAGVDVNHVNKPQWTAMQEAVVYGDGSVKYQQVVRALLDAGADQSIRDSSGCTALDNAERLGQLQIAAILRAR